MLFVAGCWYPHAESPVSGVFIRRHAEAVARRHRVTVLHTLARDDAARASRCTSEDHGRLREIELRFRHRPEALLAGARAQLAYYRAGRVGCALVAADRGVPDVVHLHVVPPFGLTAAVWRSFPAVPLVVTEHWTGYHPGRGPRLGLLRRIFTARLLRRARVITTVSENLRDVMQGRGFHGRYEVVPNVVDTEHFRPATSRREGPCRFTVVAALRPVKRVPEIVAVAAGVLDSGVDLELHVVGDGPDRAAAEKVAADSGWLGRRVFFYGIQDRDGVADRLRDSDALVLFSSFENSPCVIGEALACGVPVIAPRIAGIPEQVSEERGILVPPGDRQALAAAVADVAVGRRRFDREGLRRFAEQQLSPEVIGGRFAEIYAETLASTESKSSR